MKSIILDTNAYSRWLSGDSNVLNELVNAEVIYMSVVVVAELLTGFKGGSKESQNLEILEDFLSNSKVKTINISKQTAFVFAEIKSYLKNAGKPIPINDVWIAAHTFEFNTSLITFDNHFTQIPKIRLWRNIGNLLV